MLLLAHRGASGYAPENTFASFDLALRMRADGLETDVRATSDGALVLLHDEAVDRTTNGHGPVARLTLDEVERLDAGSWFGHEFAGERVPTLQAFLDTYGGRCTLCLEIKAPNIEADVVAAVRDRDLLASVQFTSFQFDSVVAVRSLAPTATVGFLTRRFDEEEIARVVQARISQICPAAEAVTAELVRHAHANGIAVRAWGIKNRHLLDHVVAADVDGVTVDWPDWLRRS